MQVCSINKQFNIVGLHRAEMKIYLSHPDSIGPRSLLEFMEFFLLMWVYFSLKVGTLIKKVLKYLSTDKLTKRNSEWKFDSINIIFVTQERGSLYPRWQGTRCLTYVTSLR